MLWNVLFVQKFVKKFHESSFPLGNKPQVAQPVFGALVERNGGCTICISIGPWAQGPPTTGDISLWPCSKPWNPVANQLSQEWESSMRVQVLYFWLGNHMISMESSGFHWKVFTFLGNRNSWKPVEKSMDPDDSLMPLIFWTAAEIHHKITCL